MPYHEAEMQRTPRHENKAGQPACAALLGFIRGFLRTLQHDIAANA
jgi:hypothetical protein